MKILLDENIPRRLKFDFDTNDEVISVQEMNWQGKKNGELLGLMTLKGFDVFITLDKNL
jgi:predicted nuclease of predicted toxin-antitoxin system